MSKNILRQTGRVDRARRALLLGHKGVVVWMTGLSGSGKSTIALAAEEILHNRGILSYVLDGDNLRHGLNGDLGFSVADREENIRRVGEVAALFKDAGMIVFVSLISPFVKDREKARKAAGESDFVEVYIKADLDLCEERDPKGLYKKVRKGEIPEFTGIGSPYEPPENPELTLDTTSATLAESVSTLIKFLEEKGVIPPG